MVIPIPQEAIDQLKSYGFSIGLNGMDIEQAATGSIYIYLYNDALLLRKDKKFFNKKRFSSNSKQICQADLADFGLMKKFRVGDHLPAKDYTNYVIVTKDQVMVSKGRSILPL